ncbi:MAG: peptidoglycan DD-metalloendopeptidase family protein [Cyclobacteriaceae bacterium]|nr:peptidoglycan DD-metalloendopeptidase family protein [Cyclobacteriaceae bacterium]
MITPLFQPRYTESDFLLLDFTSRNQSIQVVDLKNTAAFNRYVFDTIADHQKKAGIGGYFERRFIYQRSNHFKTAEDFREYHLGVDIWVAAGSPIHAPLPATVHSYRDNDNFGDYGPTIILEHEFEGEHLYSLYGHLSKKGLKNIEIGDKINAGEVFCHVGPYPENGNWPPHLHFQLIKDMGENEGDFPGVCSASQKEEYQKQCPDPNLFLQLDFSKIQVANI